MVKFETLFRSKGISSVQLQNQDHKSVTQSVPLSEEFKKIYFLHDVDENRLSHCELVRDFVRDTESGKIEKDGSDWSRTRSGSDSKYHEIDKHEPFEQYCPPRANFGIECCSFSTDEKERPREDRSWKCDNSFSLVECFLESPPTVSCDDITSQTPECMDRPTDKMNDSFDFSSFTDKSSSNLHEDIPSAASLCSYFLELIEVNPMTIES